METPTVYTYISEGYDVPITEGKLFTEKDVDVFKDSTKNARMVKILSHLFIDSEWSLWTDGTIKLLKSPEEILAKYKDQGDIITFHHRARSCAYDEAVAIFLGKRESNHEIVDKQIMRYRSENYPEQNGLFETGCILRKHTPKVIEFNNMWWSQVSRYSKRDQISVNYSAWKTEVKVGFFEGNLNTSEDFYIHPHLPGNILV